MSIDNDDDESFPIVCLGYISSLRKFLFFGDGGDRTRDGWKGTGCKILVIMKYYQR